MYHRGYEGQSKGVQEEKILELPWYLHIIYKEIDIHTMGVRVQKGFTDSDARPQPFRDPHPRGSCHIITVAMSKAFNKDVIEI